MAGALTASIAAAFAGSAVATTDPYFNYTTLLLSTTATNGQQNNTFQDSSTNNFTITRNPATGPNAPTQGTFSPFSQTGWGNYFTGNQSIYASNAAFAVGTGAFTVELFYNPSIWAGTNQRIFVIGQSGTDGVTIQRSSGSNVVEINISASGVTNVISYTWTPNIGQWYYIALVRSGTGTNQTALYIDGVSVATGTSTASIGSTQLSVGGINWVANYGTQGYISNVRFSNVARTITVPTAPYTSDANTLLLTCQSNRFVDNSQTPKTLTIQNAPTVVPFSPFNPTSAWSASTVGGSGYFDGTGDYLSTPSSSAFSFGTGDFTIEYWVYINSGTNNGIFQLSDTAGGLKPSQANSLAMNIFTNNSVSIYANGTSYQAPNNTLPYNSWTHFAIVRSSNVTKLYANGSLVTSIGSSGSITDNTNYTGLYVAVGGYYSTSYLMTGYVSNFRVVKGTAVYTSNFTPPTAPLTAITNTSLLLNFTNSGISDATAKNVLETVGNAQVSTTQSKWSPTSMYFDGTADYLLIPTSQQLNLSSGSWTVECWVNAQATGFSGLLSWRNANVSSLEPDLYLWNTGVIAWYFNNTNQITGTTNIVGAGWVHVAVAKNGSSTRLFVGGNKEGVTLTDNNTYLAPNTTLKVGGQVTATQWLNGYLQDVRITKGYARYVEGTGGNAGKMVLNGTNTLALPTAAFPVQ